MKPPEILPVDAMCIMKLLTCELLEHKLKLDHTLKLRRDELLSYHLKGTLIAEVEKAYPRGVSQAGDLVIIAWRDVSNLASN